MTIEEFAKKYMVWEIPRYSIYGNGLVKAEFEHNDFEIKILLNDNYKPIAVMIDEYYTPAEARIDGLTLDFGDEPKKYAEEIYKQLQAKQSDERDLVVQETFKIINELCIMPYDRVHCEYLPNNSCIVTLTKGKAKLIITKFYYDEEALANKYLMTTVNDQDLVHHGRIDLELLKDNLEVIFETIIGANNVKN
jgi:hypothetical protein